VSVGLLSEHLVDVLDRLSGQEAVRFRGFVARAQLDRPVAVEASEAAAAVRPYAWLLDRLGADGVRLTSAGHLPPAVVTEAMDALGERERWFGAANREYHTRPVLELRESARRFGLVRKHRGVLSSTKVGSSLSSDPVGLWWHVADRLPDARTEAAADAGVLLLVAVASGTPLDSTRMNRLLSTGMSALGWRVGATGAPLDQWQAFDAARDTWTALRRLGALAEENRGGAPAPVPVAGIQLARAALQQRT
jgi:hypothetical protein